MGRFLLPVYFYYHFLSNIIADSFLTLVDPKFRKNSHSTSDAKSGHSGGVQSGNLPFANEPFILIQAGLLKFRNQCGLDLVLETIRTEVALRDNGLFSAYRHGVLFVTPMRISMCILLVLLDPTSCDSHLHRKIS